MTKMKAYLTLIGEDFDTDHVTKQIGITPATVRHKDCILGNGRELGFTEWGIETDVQVIEDTDPLLKELFSMVPCDTSVLRQLSDLYDADWHILIWVRIYGNDAPAIIFSKETIEYVAKINGRIGLDTYIC